MVNKNKVVIKINYQEIGGSKNNVPQQKMVTEWHTLRVLSVIIILIVLISLCYYFFFNVTIEKEPVKTLVVAESKNKVIKEIDKNLKINIKAEIKKPFKSDHKRQLNVNIKLVNNINSEDKINPGIMTRANVSSGNTTTRALLTSGIKNKEPIDNIVEPIGVNEQEATRVFYFTEIINMEEQYLYHLWLRDNELIFKRRIKIMNNKWRAATSKLITYSRSGFWKVRLVNQEGDILNEIKFEAIKE